MPKVFRKKSESVSKPTKSKPKFRKKTREASYNATQLQNDILELANVKAQIKMLQTRETELKNRASSGVETHTKADAVGHFTYPVINAEGKKLYFQKQARTKVSLNKERLRELLEEKGMTREVFIPVQQVAPEVTQDQLIEILESHAPHYLDTIEIVDDSNLEQLMLAGEIEEKEFESVLDKNTTYAHTFVDAKLIEKDEETPER